MGKKRHKRRKAKCSLSFAVTPAAESVTPASRPLRKVVPVSQVVPWVLVGLSAAFAVSVWWVLVASMLDRWSH